ncbi:MAG: hypothetical protein KGN76_14515 [Acidobacteriota bacterium]|nr:hypothetical protein [Acidobacteriota bacterium]
MRASIWLRALAGLLVLFTLGHTKGVLASAPQGGRQAAIVGAMQGARFPIMGFLRSYWDFYHGFGLVISLLLAALAVLAWQLAGLSRQAPRAALPLTATLMLALGGLAVLSWQYFFWGPIVMSVAGFLLAGIALLLLGREAGAAGV